MGASEAGAPWVRDRHEPSAGVHFVSDWLVNLPRPIAVILAIAGFLGLINVFSGLHKIWFHWPVASLLFIAILWTVLRRRPAADRNEERRASRE